MKKHFRLLMAALVMGSMAFFASCGNDDDDDDDVTIAAPTIELVSGTGYITADAEVEVGETVMLKALISQTGAELTNAKLVLAPAGAAAQDLLDTAITGTSVTLETSFAYPDAETATLTYTVTNSGNKTATKVINLTKKVVTATLSTFSDIQLFAQYADGSSASNCASVDGTTYSLNDLLADEASQAKVDFGYHHTTDAAIISPDNLEDWAGLDGYSALTTKNVTKIYAKSAAFDFDAADGAAIEAMHSEFEAGDVQSYEDALAVDDVVPFETVGGKKGVIRVTQIEGTYNVGDYMKVDIKVLQ